MEAGWYMIAWCIIHNSTPCSACIIQHYNLKWKKKTITGPVQCYNPAQCHTFSSTPLQDVAHLATLPLHHKDLKIIPYSNQINRVMLLTCLWQAYACIMHERCPQVQPEGLEWLRLNLWALEYKPFPLNISYAAIQLKEGWLELSLGSERKSAALHKLDSDVQLWGLDRLTDAALEISIQTQKEREIVWFCKQTF